MAPEQLHGRWRRYGPWTDLYTLGCITWQFLCGRLLVVATLRSDILAERPAVARPVDALAEDPTVERHSLSPLSLEDQRELLEGLLPLEDALADHLAERTECHPLFAMQLLGHWIGDDELEVGPDGFHVSGNALPELPEDIHTLWTTRIDRVVALFDRQRGRTVEAALELAATLGREVDTREWRAVLEAADVTVPEALVDRLVDMLVERGLAAHQKRSDGWAFAHGLLVESLLERARETVVEVWERLDAADAPTLSADGWPDQTRLMKDHAWPLRLTGELARQHGDLERTRRAWQLSVTLWERLEDPEAADALRQRLDALA